MLLAWFLVKANPKTIVTFLKVFAIAIFIALALLLVISGRFYTLLPFAAVIPIVIPGFRKRNSQKKDSYDSDDTKMSLKEAYDVLGLKEGVNRQEIIEAHRRLIKKIHPDQGGTDYLARKLNEAKQQLLNNKK